MRSTAFARYLELRKTSTDNVEDLAEMLRLSCEQGYAAADSELLESCRRLQNHYSSSTAVTCLYAWPFLTIAHLGDSRAVLIVRDEAPDRPYPSASDPLAGRRHLDPPFSADGVRGVLLTEDHKPDQPEERARIELAGGSVQRLHHHANRPFIRGGDFVRRKAAGERVMQLQYSRAFGGKDLKPFGLSACPDVFHVRISTEGPFGHLGVVLASDGVWDVCTANDAAAVVVRAARAQWDPARALVAWAARERERLAAGADNITAVVALFEDPARRRERRRGADAPSAP
jgi:protein phosphatase